LTNKGGQCKAKYVFDKNGIKSYIFSELVFFEYYRGWS